MVKSTGTSLRNIHRQSGNKPNIEIDASLYALPPGMRRSRRGKVYWETRKNRTDLSRKTHL